jgi:hypothetical protein
MEGWWMEGWWMEGWWIGGLVDGGWWIEGWWIEGWWIEGWWIEGWWIEGWWIEGWFDGRVGGSRGGGVIACYCVLERCWECLGGGDRVVILHRALSAWEGRLGY